jgi:cytochrome c-type biogenesis protein CcmH
MALGGLISVSDRRLRVGAPRRAPRRSPRRSLRRVATGACLALLLFLPGPAGAIDADEMFDDPVKEARALAIGKELRCLVCQNQSIFDSNAGLARDLRLLVRERMEAGDSDEEIVAYVVARYGDYVLLEPPVKLGTYALWAAPLALVGIALLGAGLYLRRRTPPEALDAEERARARRILGEGAP